MSRPYSHHRSVSTHGQGQRSATSDYPTTDPARKHQTWSSRHIPGKTSAATRHDRRHSRGGTVSDYEDVYQSQARRQAIPKQQKHYEDGDIFGLKQYRDPNYQPFGYKQQQNIKPTQDPKPRPRHATFHESTNDPTNRPLRRTQQASQASQAQNRSSSSSHYFRSLNEWRKSVANLLDKSQLSAVDRFRRRTLGFRMAVCIGLILATTAVVAAIMSTVYYARLHRQPLLKPKVHVLASINGTLRLLDMPFREILEDHDSPEFRQLEAAICSTIRDAVVDSSFCSVNKFRNGSVIADFQFKVDLPSMNDVEQKGNSMGVTGLMQNRRREEIMANLTSKKLSKLGHKFNLFIDPEFTRQPGVDLFITEVRTQKVVRIADVQPVLDNKDVEALCHENSTELLETNYFPDRTDCRAFLVCDGALLYRLTCGKGTAWNDEELTCDFKSKTNCTYQSDADDADAELPAKVHSEYKTSPPKSAVTPTTTTTTTEATTRLLIQGRRNAQFRYRSSFDENAPTPPKKRPAEAVDDEDSEMMRKVSDEDVPKTTTKKAKLSTSKKEKEILAKLEEIDFEEVPIRTVAVTKKPQKKKLSPLELAAMAAAETTEPPTTTPKPKSNGRLRDAIQAAAEETPRTKKKAAMFEENAPSLRLELPPKRPHVAFIGDVSDEDEDVVAATKARRTVTLAATAAERSK